MIKMLKDRTRRDIQDLFGKTNGAIIYIGEDLGKKALFDSFVIEDIEDVVVEKKNRTFKDFNAENILTSFNEDLYLKIPIKIVPGKIYNIKQIEERTDDND